jgi:hypothetical protein
MSPGAICQQWLEGFAWCMLDAWVMTVRTPACGYGGKVAGFPWTCQLGQMSVRMLCTYVTRRLRCSSLADLS